MMHRESCACGTDSLELFKVPPTNITLEDSKWMEYYPISSTLNSDTAPIEFEIKGQGDEYLHLSQSYLQMVCKFTKADETALTGAGSTSTPVNNILHSLFSEIDVSLNGKVITPGTDTYPYKAYLEKLLSYAPKTLKTQMRACTLWEKDTAGQMEDREYSGLVQPPKEFNVVGDKVTINAMLPTPIYPDDSQNVGLRKRHHKINNSKEIVLMDRLHLDLFQQEKCLPNGVDVRLRFNRARPQFYMMTDVGSSGESSHSKVEVKTFTIPTGTQSKITDHLFQGQMPKLILLGFVENVAFNGDDAKNPFNFQNQKIKKLEVSINGDMMETRPLEPNFTADQYLRSYLSLYKGLGKLGQDWAPDITLEEYKNGYTLWCMDFTKDQEAQTDKFHLIQTGNLRVEVQFADSIATTLNCVVYAVFDNLLEINKQREVSIDY
ncbi:uncharacterized protein F54H12.2-like [Ostrea edulis]|uniref:uncharacterized protein F54H12.2-like n=1 Tax=Ostrea edulis TaxID=37623 RepID=UPI0024AF79D9|nr:uncharacterized protein F54H12.2-like [Ostrea edulis]